MRKITKGGVVGIQFFTTSPKGETMQLMNVKQVSQMLAVKESTLYDWVEKNKIPYRKMGRLVRFNHDEIVRWLKNLKGEKNAVK